MKNYYQTNPVVIEEARREAEDVKLFRLEFRNKKEQAAFSFRPGQFVELSIPGFGEAPFAICSSPAEKEYFEICVRKAGLLTAKLHSLKRRDKVGIRGPYGAGLFSLPREKNILLVAGGLGLIPLRPVIYSIIHNFKGRAQLFYGAKASKEFLFRSQYKSWKKHLDFQITLDKGEPGWKGHVGLITTLFDDVQVIKDAQAFLCGPPIMYRFVLKKLQEHGFKDEDIFISLERRMHCGVGSCQHCGFGPYYVCKHGPVFSWKDIKDIPNVI